MSKDSYIGVFDSGIGGLSVVKSLMDLMPNENIIYFGDTARVPYGTRSKAQIIKYVYDDVAFLRQFDLKAIVIACNTADSVARARVEKVYKDLPFYGVVEPASALAARTTKGTIGVIATNATIKSKAYETAIARYNPVATVIPKACPLLVPLVESGRISKEDIVVVSVLKEYLNPMVAQGMDTLILGCTHYPLLQPIIEELYPDLNIVSSSHAAAENVMLNLKEDNMMSNVEGYIHKYYVSDKPDNFEANARLFLGAAFDGKVEQVDVERRFKLTPKLK